MTPTPTSDAADLPEALRRSTAADGKTELLNLPGYPLMVRAVDFNRIHAESEMRRTALLDEMQKAALAAGQATAAQRGAYAAPPDEREAFEAWLRSVWTAGYGCPKCDSGKYVHGEAQRFWECWQARASHGQAPAGAGEPTEQQILEAAFAPAQPAVEASRFGSPELQAMVIARCVEKDQADSVREDAARYRFLRDGEWRDTDLEPFIRLQLNTLWDAKIDAARKQGEKK